MEWNGRRINRDRDGHLMDNGMEWKLNKQERWMDGMK